MTRSLRVLLACILVLGGVLLSELETQVDTTPELQTGNAATEASVREFYAGLNRFLANGDRSVQLLLAPDFRDHSLATRVERTADAMLATLSEAAVASPAVRFVIESIDLSDSMAAVDIRFEAMRAPEIAGRTTNVGQSHAMVDFLRLDRTRVTERWSNDDLLPAIRFAIETEFTIESAPLMSLRIERWTLEPLASVTMLAGLPVVFAVERGWLRVGANGVDAAGEAVASGVPMVAGDARSVDPSGDLELRNLDRSPTVVWVAGGFPDQPQLLDDQVPDGSGVTRAVYAFGTMRVTTQPAERFRLSVTQLTLPGETVLPPSRPTMIELTAVLDGNLYVTVADGFVSHCLADASSQLVGDDALAAAGQGVAASVTADSHAAYQVAGMQPGTFIFATIEPVNALD